MLSADVTTRWHVPPDTFLKLCYGYDKRYAIYSGKFCIWCQFLGIANHCFTAFPLRLWKTPFLCSSEGEQPGGGAAFSDGLWHQRAEDHPAVSGSHPETHVPRGGLWGEHLELWIHTQGSLYWQRNMSLKCLFMLANKMHFKPSLDPFFSLEEN